MKFPIILALTLAGCGSGLISPEQIALANKMCEAHGGLKLIITAYRYNKFDDMEVICKDTSNIRRQFDTRGKGHE